MKKKRNTSYIHCSNLIFKLLEIQEFKKVSIEIMDVNEKSIELNIKIDEKLKNMTIDNKINKIKNKVVNPDSYKNLKNYKNKETPNGENDLDKKLSMSDNINKSISSNNIKIENKNNKNNITESEINLDITLDKDKEVENNSEYSNIYEKDKKNKNDIILDSNLNVKNNITEIDIELNKNKENKSIQNEETLTDNDDSDSDDDNEIIIPTILCDNCDETRRICQENFDAAKEYHEKYERLLIKYNEMKTKLNNDILEKDKNYKKFDVIVKKLLLINHNSFNKIGNILSTLEKANPKKVHEILNKNINAYKKQMEGIADEGDKIQQEYAKLIINL